MKFGPATTGILCQTTKHAHQLYVYTVKNQPELVKVGIAENATKRKEFYYDKLAHCVELCHRDALLVELLFHHATWYSYSTEPVKMEVMNHHGRWAVPAIKAMYEARKESHNQVLRGGTELRQMGVQEAIDLIAQIQNDVATKTVRELLSSYLVPEVPMGFANDIDATEGLDRLWSDFDSRATDMTRPAWA